MLAGSQEGLAPLSGRCCPYLIFLPTHSTEASELKVFYCNDVLENYSQIEAKGLSADEKYQLVGAIVKKKPATRKHSTLLIDDLYQTGTTLNQCTSLLRDDPLVDKIYVLTITKTKNQ